jgi:mono/diheme cytochrome c family protein
MKVPVRIAILVVAVCAFYTYVGNSVPQAEQHPPKDVGAGASPAELAQAGSEIFTGACAQCHGVPGQGGTERAPDLGGVAQRSEQRARQRAEQTGEPYTGDDYLAESLMSPGAYLAERQPGQPFGNIMSFRLEPMQTLAVLAYLQSLGGEPSVTVDGPVWTRWGASLMAQAAPGAPAPAREVGPPEQIVRNYGCVGCHDLVGQNIPPGGGPPLSDIGARMSVGDILMQILDPDSQIAAPRGAVTFARGILMPAIAGFLADAKPADLLALATWLSEKKGAQ